LVDELTAQPLKGISVLEFAETLPGPYCGKVMADLGASVVKIERPGTGDPLRSIMPSMFEVFNRGKASLALDLKNSASGEIVAELMQRADVVLEGWRPGVATRLGVGWDTARKLNPKLVYCAISGFGQQGPDAGRSGHDATYAAAAGLLGPAARHDRTPTMMPAPVGDLAAGAIAAISVLAAILECRSTGIGRFCDIAITDVLATWTAAKAAEFLETGRMPDFSEQQPPTHDIYQGSDGRFLALGAIEDPFWERLCRVVGKPEWTRRASLRTNTGRARARDEVGSELQAIFSQGKAESWVRKLVAADVPASVVRDISETVGSDRFRSRRIFGVNSTSARRPVGFPAVLDGIGVGTGGSSPGIGEDTAKVLGGIGCSTTQILQWHEEGLFGESMVMSGGGNHDRE